MADAYTPGLAVTPSTIVRKVRRLPLRGRVLFQAGQSVRAQEVVARTELPGKVHLLNMANILGVAPDELEDTLQVELEQPIRKGQLLAEHRSLFGLLRQEVISPIDGVLESVSRITGQAVLRGHPAPVDVRAYVDGTVVECLPEEGVIIETHAALIQGIFGLGPECHATLSTVCDRSDQVLSAGSIEASHSEKILIGGARVTLEALRKAMDVGVRGIVCGGFSYQDIRQLLGYDIGVAITGSEPIDITLVVTEGFGDIAMAEQTFTLLKSFDGQAASINGATQIRAGVIRPEVVIPQPGRAHRGNIDDKATALALGASVRCVRAPYFGRLGTVAELPIAPAKMPSEAMVRVVKVALADGETVLVPRANIEVIES